MVISQGDIWWAELDEPKGASRGFRRPVVVVQSDVLNMSDIGTVVCVPLTGNVKWAGAPGAAKRTAHRRSLGRNGRLAVHPHRGGLNEPGAPLP